jgi:hypothetical protein
MQAATEQYEEAKCARIEYGAALKKNGDERRRRRAR